MQQSTKRQCLALLAVMTLCAYSGNQVRADPAAPASAPSHQERNDQPGEAAEFYARKRLAPGMTQIPVERLLQGYAQMKAMPHYSSASGLSFANDSDVDMRAPATITAAWSELGPGNIGGRTRAIVIDPGNPNTMYAGGVGGGVWKSINGGGNWAPVSDSMANIAVVSLAMDPGNSSVLYAGTGEGSFNGDALRGAGIFKSTNAGATWIQLAATSGSNFHYVNDLQVAPSNSQIVVAATGKGIFVSTNGGTSFTQRSTETLCLDLAVTTIAATDTWLAACGNYSPGKVLRSTDTITWTQTLGTGPQDLNAMGRTAVAIRGTRAYAIATSLVPGFDRTGDSVGDYRDQLHAFFRSDDGGQTWTATVRNNDAHWGNTMLLSGYFSCANLTLGTGQGWYDIAVAIDPANSDFVWVGGINLFRSSDGGLNWGRGDAIHPDHHFITFDPQYNGTTNQTIFNGQDGGIYRTTNGRAAVAMLPAAPGGSCTPTSPVVSWGSLNNGYAVTQFYHGTAYPDGTSYLAGAQDNGTNLGTDASGPNAWSFLACGDGGYTGVDPGNTNILYAGCQNVDIRRSTNGGSSFSNGDNGISTAEGSLFIPPFVIDPNTSTRLWFGGTRAWRTDDAALNWIAASTPFNSGNDQVTAIAVATGNSNLVLMGGDNVTNRIYRTTAASTATSATAWTSTVVNGYVAALAFAPSNSNIAYAAISTYGVPHVLKSTDGGSTWNSASGSGGGALPDVPALGIVVHPSDANRIYVGTDIGVFVTLDGGANWAAEITSFPNVSTEWLQIIGSGNAAQLFAFTHGRGAFKLSLASGPGTLGFAAAAQTVFEGSTAQVSVNRSSGSDGAVSVTYQTNNGTAIAPGDYTSTTGTLNWADGDAAPKIIMVPIIDDGIPEAAETFTVTLSNPTNGATLGTATHTVTIAASEVFPPNCQIPAGYSTPAGGSQAWVVATDSVQEGSCSLRSPTGLGNNNNARIQTSGTFSAGNVSFYARVSSELSYDCFRFLVDGVAQNIGTNCNNSGNPAISGEFAWQLISVPTTAGTHTFTWVYDKDGSDTGGADAAWIDLVTLPPPPGTGPTITSAAPSGGTFAVAYMHTYTASGSPAPTFSLLSGSFPPGLTLTGAVLSGTPSQAGTFTGTVRASNTGGNNDQAFSITIAAVVPGAPTLSTLTPGNASATATFTAPGSNGGATVIDYTVSCTPGPITATAGTSPITVTGLTNGTPYQCTVKARNSVGSSAASNALSATPIGVPGTLGFATAAQTVSEGSTAQVPVNRSGGSNGAVAVSYQTNNGTAIAPGDYTVTSGTLNWADGDAAPKTIMVPIIDDGIPEATETFTVTLSNPTNGATLGTATHTVTIAASEIFPPNCQFPVGYSTPAGGSQAWVVATDSVQEGGCSLRSPVGLGNSSNARIQTSGNFSAGNVSFYARVSSELGWDCFRFLVDGVQQNIGSSCANIGNPGIAGEFAWQQITVPTTAGTHTFTWSYEKDTTDFAGSDAAWIDLVTLPPAATGPTISSAAPVGGTFGASYTHTYTATGTPAPTFALLSGSFPPGLTLTGAVLSGTPSQAGTFTGTVRASNTGGTNDQAFSITIAAVAPGAPTLSTLTPGNGSATATFAAPGGNGGASIIDYTVSCTPGPVTATASNSPIMVTGLTNATSYQCTVKARNSVGSSVASNALSVTPTDPAEFIFANGFD